MKNKSAYFQTVFEANKDKIYRLCLGFMGNSFDADDLYQEVLIKIWDNLDNFRSESAISTWIYRITTNTAIYYSKQKSRAQKKETNAFPSQFAQPELKEQTQENEAKIKALYAAIATLKEIDRIIIGLVLEGTPYEMIAEITGLKVSNVGVRINRIKKALNKKLVK